MMPPQQNALLPFPPHELSRISADTLKAWSRCKRQFVYKYVARLQWPSDARHFSLGKEVHKLLDYQSRNLPCDVLLETAEEKVKRSYEKLIRHRTTQWPVIASEWEFNIPMRLSSGKVEWLNGRMDRVSRDGDKVWIIDWKTGMGAPRNASEAWQTRLYLFALLELAQSPSAADLGIADLTPEKLGFLYVIVKADLHSAVEEVPLAYSGVQHEATRQFLLTTLETMSVEEDYLLPDRCPDRYCLYRKLCGMSMPG
jgi:hypothetical protein